VLPDLHLNDMKYPTWYDVCKIYVPAAAAAAAAVLHMISCTYHQAMVRQDAAPAAVPGAAQVRDHQASL
jgi:hypothetical protein